jgi:hypothetical protein
VPFAWLQVSVRAEPSALDVIANFLIERGSPGVVLRKREVQGYFAADESTFELRGDLQRFPAISRRSIQRSTKDGRAGASSKSAIGTARGRSFSRRSGSGEVFWFARHGWRRRR